MNAETLNQDKKYVFNTEGKWNFDNLYKKLKTSWLLTVFARSISIQCVKIQFFSLCRENAHPPREADAKEGSDSPDRAQGKVPHTETERTGCLE